MPDAQKYPCPCCGYYTLPKEPPGTYDICQVCRWEDDPVQFKRPTLRGGANRPSLEEARQNFRFHGWASEHLKEYARPPRSDEYPPPRNGTG
jgi:rubredoxin